MSKETEQLAELEGQIIELVISFTKFGVVNSFHGKIVGRVRVIWSGHDAAVWVGQFCFDADSVVERDEYGDGPGSWKLRVELEK